MSLRRVILCDGCGAAGFDPTDDPGTWPGWKVRERLRKAGWWIAHEYPSLDGRDLCPDCVRKETNNE